MSGLSLRPLWYSGCVCSFLIRLDSMLPSDCRLTEAEYVAGNHHLFEGPVCRVSNGGCGSVSQRCISQIIHIICEKLPSNCH